LQLVDFWRFSCLVLEVVHHGGSRARAVDQNEAETPGRVRDGKAGQRIGSGTFTQSYHVLDVQVVQNCHQVFAQGGHRWEIEARTHTFQVE
jgi:hypothetical protein